MPGACSGSPINGSPSCSRQLQRKASAPMGLALGLLAPADPRAIAALDHAGNRLDGHATVTTRRMDAALVGLDVGTTGARAVAINRTGTFLATATQEYPLATPRPGWTEQDPETWWLASARRTPRMHRAPCCSTFTRAIGQMRSWTSSRFHASGCRGCTKGRTRLAASPRPQRPRPDCRQGFLSRRVEATTQPPPSGMAS